MDVADEPGVQLRNTYQPAAVRNANDTDPSSHKDIKGPIDVKIGRI